MIEVIVFFFFLITGAGDTQQKTNKNIFKCNDPIP